MNWKQHWNLKGKHAFLGASKCSWLNYDDETLITRFQNSLAAERGTKMHELAATMIEMRVRAQRSKQTFSMYVNDAIGFGMSPEVILYYSDNVYGTADAILWDEQNNFLRIHDLKTGVGPVHIEQLKIYAALFCLEYQVDVSKIDLELRIYQNGEISYVNTTDNPEVRDEIRTIEDLIVRFDKVLNEYKKKTGEE